MNFNLDKLDASEWWIVKWQYRLLGDFHRVLFEAICRADETNLYKLSLGFPDEVEGYKKYATESGWWTDVQRKIGREGT